MSEDLLQYAAHLSFVSSALGRGCVSISFAADGSIEVTSGDYTVSYPFDDRLAAMRAMGAHLLEEAEHAAAKASELVANATHRLYLPASDETAEEDLPEDLGPPPQRMVPRP